MRRGSAALGLALLARAAAADPAYVSDEIVLNVYSQENDEGPRLATLHSGAILEALSVSGEYTQVRTVDGAIGWVKSAYLTSHEPATVRLAHLEEEISRTRATTPALAEAAARSELQSLRQQLDALRNAPTAIVAPTHDETRAKPWLLLCACVIGLIIGFCTGYAVLAHRLKQKFGGIKVY